eukprot:8180219-Pyramimonas_sp.AAC.1
MPRLSEEGIGNTRCRAPPTPPGRPRLSEEGIGNAYNLPSFLFLASPRWKGGGLRNMVKSNAFRDPPRSSAASLEEWGWEGHETR